MIILIESYESILGSAILCGVLVFAFSFFLTPIARRFDLIDRPDTRKLHDGDVPTVGGLAIFFALSFVLNFIDLPREFFWILVSGGLLIIAGAIDDAVSLGIRLRLLLQSLATIVMIIGSGVWIASIGIEFGEFRAVAVTLGVPFTVFCVVGMTNCINMTDGLDGLAAGHMLIALLTVCLMFFYQNGYVAYPAWFAILSSALFVFLMINLSLTPLSKVFLGDAGALFLGFALAWTLIIATQNVYEPLPPYAALWCLTIPVFDVIAVVLNRARLGKSPFLPDRLHLHHLLIDSGVDPRVALFAMLMLATVVNAIGIFMVASNAEDSLLWVYILFLAGYCSLATMAGGQSKQKMR